METLRQGMGWSVLEEEEGVDIDGRICSADERSVGFVHLSTEC